MQMRKQVKKANMRARGEKPKRIQPKWRTVDWSVELRDLGDRIDAAQYRMEDR